jgi:hypothetical protein
VAFGFGNDTTDPVRVERVGLELQDDPAGFAIGEDGCSGTTLQPQQTCTVSIAFRPAQPGDHRAAIGFLLTMLCLDSSVADPSSPCSPPPASTLSKPSFRRTEENGKVLLTYSRSFSIQGTSASP